MRPSRAATLSCSPFSRTSNSRVATPYSFSSCENSVRAWSSSTARRASSSLWFPSSFLRRWISFENFETSSMSSFSPNAFWRYISSSDAPCSRSLRAMSCCSALKRRIQSSI